MAPYARFESASLRVRGESLQGDAWNIQELHPASAHPLPIHVWTAKTRGAVVILKDAFHQCSQFQYPFTELEVGEFQFATDTVDQIIHFKYSFVRKDDETDTQVWAELFVQLQLHYMP